jgi:hypothetical protein
MELENVGGASVVEIANDNTLSDFMAVLLSREASTRSHYSPCPFLSSLCLENSVNSPLPTPDDLRDGLRENDFALGQEALCNLKLASRMIAFSSWRSNANLQPRIREPTQP